MKKGRDTRFSCKRSGNAGYRNPYSPVALLLQYTLFAPPPPKKKKKKNCIAFVFNFSWVLHSSKEKLKIMLTVFFSKNAAALIKYFYGKMRLLFEGSVYFSESWTQNKNCLNYGIITVKPRLIRTPT